MPKEVISIVPAFSADYPRAPIYVADLVRCKNCKSYETKAFQDGYGYCKGHCSVVQDDDFCSYAELKSKSENSNLTFEKDECAKEYEELGLKELKELIAEQTEPRQTHDLRTDTHGVCLDTTEPRAEAIQISPITECISRRGLIEPSTDCGGK